MKRVKNQILSQFFDELRFAPIEQKEMELTRAEELLTILHPQREYPFEFICYKITDYRPKGDISDKFISGIDLINGLTVFINKVGRQLVQNVADQPENILTSDQIAKKIAVSSKTIHRWHKKGLRGRVFIFEDGKKKLGFLQSTIDNFLTENPEIVKNAGNFSRLSSEEKKRIITISSTLAMKKRSNRNQIIQEVAAQTNRSPETIRMLLVKHDKESKDKSPFRKSFGKMRSRDTKHLYRLFNQDVGIEELMAKYDRSRSSIYRIINNRRAKDLLAKKVSYIESPEFLEPDETVKILSLSIEKLILSLTNQENNLLNRDQEIDFFRRYNYLKYLSCTKLDSIKPGRCRGRDLRQIETWLGEAEQIKKLIIEANLRLVASIAGKHLNIGAAMADLISEGNFSLMRAVEKFDYTRGYRFSTYATWAIAKDFARKIPAEARRPDKPVAADMSNIQQNMRIGDIVDFGAIERAHHSLDEVIKNNLTDREQFIVRNHFALEPGPVKKKPKTLKQIGDFLNLSSERVRQIELGALQKLRQNLSPEQFDLLTG